jgi:hypothetical protein
MAAADLIQAPRQLIQVQIPPRAPQLIRTPPREEVPVALGEDVDNQLQQQIIQEQAASIVGEHDYRLLMEMVPTMREGASCSCVSRASRNFPDQPYRPAQCSDHSASEG